MTTNTTTDMLRIAMIQSIVRKAKVGIIVGEGETGELVDVLDSMVGVIVEAVFPITETNKVVTGFYNGSDFALNIETV